jgi:phage-related minor tail protein
MSNNLGVKITGDGSDLQKALQGASRDVEDFGKKTAASFNQLDTLANGFKSSFVNEGVAGFEQLGMSAKAYLAATRGIPAQFTDIFTSLQAGQAPLTVFLQQGGQLKDMFGGVGMASKALGGYLVGLVNPATVAAAAVAGVALAYYRATTEVDAYRKALVMSGTASGMTIDKMQAMALSVSQSTKTTVGASADALSQMAGSGDIASANLAKLTESAIRFEKLGGVAIKDTVKAYSELANDPVSASAKLNNQYNYLTTSVYEQIKALAEQGDKAGAVSLAQNELAIAQARMANELEVGLGRVEQAWNLAGKSAKKAWDEFVGLFRPDPIQNIIAELEAKMKFGSGIYGVGVQDKANIQEQLNYWRHIQASNDDYAATQKRNAQQTAAQITLDTAYASGLDKISRARREISALSGAFAVAEQTPENIAKYAKSVQDIVDKSQDLSTKSVKITEAAKGLALYNDLADTSAGFEKTWAESVNQLRAALDAKLISQEGFNTAINALLAKQPAIKAAADEEKKIADSVTKSHFDAVIAQQKHTASIEEQLKKQIEHNATIGLSKEAIADLEVANLNLQATELERQASLKDSIMWDASITDGYLAQAKALRELALAKATGAQKQVAVTAAKDMADAQRKAAEESGKYWEDALMRAFESGKGFFQALWDTIKNTLKTQVLKVGIQAFMGTAGAGASGLAMAGGSGGGNLLGTASTLGNMYDSLTGGFDKLSATVSGGLQHAADWMSTSSSDMLAKLGDTLSTNTSAISSVAGYAAGAAAGLAIGNAISGQFGSSNTVTAGTIIGSIVGGPIGGAIGGAIGGLINRAFGMGNTELQSQGTRGTFAASGAFSGQNYANYHQEGGWFRSDKNWTDTSAIDPKTVNSWQNAFIGVKNSVSGMATSLGLATDKIASYTKTIDVAAGTTAEQVTALFTSMADDMARAAAPGIAALAKEGESASATLSRLGTSLATVNQYLSLLDHTLLATSLSGGDAASKLADVFGGLDNFAASTKAYYDTYYTQAERLDQTTLDVAKALALVGVAMPSTKEAFRAVVTSLDLTTDAGRSTYAVMMALAPEFATVADAASASLKQVFDTFKKSVDDLVGSLQSAREGVASAKAGMIGTEPRNLAQIATAVSAALPTDTSSAKSALDAANAAAARPNEVLAFWQDRLTSVSAANTAKVDAAQASMAAQVADYKSLAAYFQNTAVAFNGYQIKANAGTAPNNDAFSYNADTNRLNGFAGISDATQTGRSYRDFLADSQRFMSAMTTNGTLDKLKGANTVLIASEKALADARAKSAVDLAAYQKEVTDAQVAQTAALAAVKAAEDAYGAALTKYVADMGKSTQALTKLKDETVAYYEAQKALTEGMATSAASLRSAATAARFGTLSTSQSLAQQRADFAKNYSLGLATTGGVKAAYADKLTAALPTLASALADTASTRSEWVTAVATLAAQSNALADQLDAEVSAATYQAESLALLSTIDTALANMQSDAATISQAVNAGADLTALGLRAVVKQLGGVPSFDVGTNYVPSDMLARVHQGEAIVPRRYNTGAGAGGMGGNTQRLEQLVQDLTTEVANLRIEARATASNTNLIAKLADRIYMEDSGGF